METRKIVLLTVALVIAGGTVMMARSALKVQAPVVADGAVAPAPAPTVVEILVASQDLPTGSIIKESDVKWQAWPAKVAGDVYVVRGQKELGEFTGSVVRQGLRAGEPIMTNRLVRSTEQGFLAAVLMPGKRAISIPITPASGVAGFVFPGDRVDVIVTHKVTRQVPGSQGTNEYHVSETVLKDVRVLALDQKTNDQAREVKIATLATLEVAPEEAEHLALINEMGTLSLVLRGLAVDEPPSAIKIPSAEGSFTLDSDVSQVMQKPSNRSGQVQRVQIMRGKEMTETVFDAQ